MVVVLKVSLVIGFDLGYLHANNTETGHRDKPRITTTKRTSDSLTLKLG